MFREDLASRLTLLVETSLVMSAKDSNNKHSLSNYHSVISSKDSSYKHWRSHQHLGLSPQDTNHNYSHSNKFLVVSVPPLDSQSKTVSLQLANHLSLKMTNKSVGFLASKTQILSLPHFLSEEMPKLLQQVQVYLEEFQEMVFLVQTSLYLLFLEL